MKNLKFLSFMLFAILSVGFISCGDDDDEIGGKDTLVGTWQCTWSEGYEKYLHNSDNDDEWNGAEDFTTTFKADGTVTADGDTGKWKLEGNKLTMTFTYGNDETESDVQVFTVLKLTDSEMIIESYEKNDEYEYYDKSTFKKI